MSSAFVKFECFSQDLAEKKHNLNTDQLNVALTNTAPNVATNTVLADITQISGTNGYTTGGSDTQNATSRSGGVTSVTGVDVTWTSVTGNMGPFRYVILYNLTASGGPLIGYWDRGASLTLDGTQGDQFVTDFGASMFTVS